MRVKGPLASVNAFLKSKGRAERVVRGDGYWYLHGGEAHTFSESILPPCSKTAEHMISGAVEVFARAGITL